MKKTIAQILALILFIAILIGVAIYLCPAEYVSARPPVSELTAPHLPNRYMSIAAAIKEGNIERVKQFIEHGYDVNIRLPGISCCPPGPDKVLIHAIRYKQREIVKYLIKSGADINVSGAYSRSAVQTVYKTDDIEMLRLLKSLGCEDDDFYEIMLAIKLGKEGVVKQILSEGIDINKRWDKTPFLCEAVKYGQHKVAEELLQNGANPNASVFKGKSALTLAVTKNDFAMTELLLKNRARPNNVKNKSAVVHAVEKGDYKLLKLLLDNGAEVDSVAEYGDTLIYRAVQLGHLDVVKLLIKRGADLNVRDERKTWSGRNNNKTLLDEALLGMHVEISKLLISKGAKFTDCTINTKYRMEMAIKGHNFEMVRFLHGLGVSYDFGYGDGDEVFFQALIEGDIDGVDVKLMYGASPNCLFKYGITPYGIALTLGNKKLLKLLKFHSLELKVGGTYYYRYLYRAVKINDEKLALQLLKNGKVAIWLKWP